MCCLSATFAVWSSAWLHGRVASDDFLDALSSWGSAHEFIVDDDSSAELFELPHAGEMPGAPAQILTMLRRNKISHASLVLPVPGDVRGLAGGGPFTQSALDGGEALLLFDQRGVPQHGLVPHKIASGLFRWTLFTPESAILDNYLSFKDAEYNLGTALRESTETLRLLDVAGNRSDVRLELAAHLRAQPELRWPVGTPGSSLRVLQRANEIAAILWLAKSDEPGGAVSASSARLRSDTLRTLDNALRLARQAAVNEAIRVLITPRE